MRIKVKDNRPYVIRDRYEHYEFTRCWSIDIARDIIKDFEQQDKKEHCYEPNYYEIYNSRTEKVVA